MPLFVGLGANRVILATVFVVTSIVTVIPELIVITSPDAGTEPPPHVVVELQFPETDAVLVAPFTLPTPATSSSPISRHFENLKENGIRTGTERVTEEPDIEILGKNNAIVKLLLHKNKWFFCSFFEQQFAGYLNVLKA